MTRIVFYDLETSGLIIERHEIIQLAAVAVDRDFRELGRFERKLKFSLERASEEALEMNSYNAQPWGRDAVPAAAALGDFSAWLRDFADVELVSKRTGKRYKVAAGAGHNARRFDDRWIRRACDHYDVYLPLSFQVLDTIELAQWWRWQAQPEGLENLRLETLCQYFGIEIDAHDAMGDAVASAKVAQALLALVGAGEAAGGPFLPDHDPCEDCQGTGYCLECAGGGSVLSGGVYFPVDHKMCNNCKGTGICPGCGKGGKK